LTARHHATRASRVPLASRKREDHGVISAYLSAQGHIVAALVFLKEVRGDQL
jgi:hypothetical protein